MEALGGIYIISLRQRIFICRIVFSFIFLCLLYAAASDTLLHQLQSPILKYAYVDPVVWVMHLLHIPELVTSDYTISFCFDSLLFITCIFCIIFPLRRFFILLFLILYFIYFTTVNSFGTHHSHAAASLLFVPVPFLFKGDRNFSLMWQGLRYYALFIFTSAFLWKLFRLTWLNKDQGILILKKNITPYLYYHPDTFFAKIYWWLLQNAWIANLLFSAGFIMEGCFIIGFFTKRCDKLFFIFYFILIAGFGFMADALFFQLLILTITFLNFEKAKKQFI